MIGRTEPRQVERVFLNRTTELVHVGVRDETISATPSHLFWVEGTGWVDAGDLEAGMRLSLADGESATIISVVREHLVSPVDVYNFQVADFHTYFVASAGVWVHNECAAANVSVKGMSRGQHRYYANKELYKRLAEGGKYAKKMRAKYGDDAIEEFISNKGKLIVRGTQWHHNKQEGELLRRRATMTLKTRAEHRAWHGANGKIGGFAQGVGKGWYR